MYGHRLQTGMRLPVLLPPLLLLLGCAHHVAAAAAAAAAAVESSALIRSAGSDTVKIEPWGANSLRIRVALGGRSIQDLAGALIRPGSDNKGAAPVPVLPSAVTVHESAARITNGNIAATIGPSGLINVSRVSDSAIILRELSRTTVENASLDGNPRYSQTSVIFAAERTDKVFGMGEHLHGKLDNKNVVQVAYRHPPKGPVMLKNWTNVSYDFEQCLVYRGGASQNGLGGNGGGSVCIPWIITASEGSSSSFGLSYGFLWNMPNYGTVSFWDTNTTWMAEAATQIDYFITVPPAGATPAEAGSTIMNAYVDAVGHSPNMPSWGAGYWHSRNRYSSQGMLLDAVSQGFASFVLL